LADLAHGQAPHRFWHTNLAKALHRFTLHLQSWLESEAFATDNLVRERLALLERFRKIADDIEEAELPRDEVLRELEGAVAAMRQHAERERQQPRSAQ